MRFLVGCFLLLVCSVGLAQESANYNDSMMSIEQEVKLMQQDLRKALILANKSSARPKEMQLVIESSKKSIERLEQKIADSDQITSNLKASYQQRIRMLKELVRQLEQRLAEANELNASFENIETESMKTVKAQQATIALQRVGLITLGVVATVVLTWNFINVVRK